MKMKMKDALKILNSKKLGFLVVVNNKGLNVGVFTDGDLKRLLQKINIKNLMIKFMTKPYKVEENMLASEILTQMNKRKITNVSVYKNDKNKTIYNSYPSS